VSEALVVNGAAVCDEANHTMDEDSVIFKQRCAAQSHLDKIDASHQFDSSPQPTLTID
jgi:hypothetical protein